MGVKITWVVALGCLICLCGCQREHVNKKDSFHFPIVVSSDTEQIVNDNGTMDVHEKGGACILSYWDNHRTYDENGVLMKYDNTSGIWPFYDIKSSETADSKQSSGTILLFSGFNS